MNITVMLSYIPNYDYYSSIRNGIQNTLKYGELIHGNLPLMFYRLIIQKNCKTSNCQVFSAIIIATNITGYFPESGILIIG